MYHILDYIFLVRCARCSCFSLLCGLWVWDFGVAWWLGFRWCLLVVLVLFLLLIVLFSFSCHWSVLLLDLTLVLCLVSFGYGWF